MFLTKPCTVPTARQQAGQPDKAQTSDGSSPQRSSLSRGSGGHSDARSADTSGSVSISSVAVKVSIHFKLLYLIFVY